MRIKLLKKLRRKYPAEVPFGLRIVSRKPVDIRNDILLEVDRMREKNNNKQYKDN